MTALIVVAFFAALPLARWALTRPPFDREEP